MSAIGVFTKRVDMEPFRVHTGLVAPLDRANVDTDQIIPKQFLKRIEKTGFGEFLFHDWRRTASGEKDNSFVLNQPRYDKATVLVAGKNFGCGSSREHAVWALADFGFRAVIAPSFADIFSNNSVKNGFLNVTLGEDEVNELLRRAQANEAYQLTVDLEKCEVRDAHGLRLRFTIDPFVRQCLLEGLDEIGLTLQHQPAIDRYEASHPLPLGVRELFN
jgi:3-isopropylmalate/(R)-2-methylmalate dehydratase small subunit